MTISNDANNDDSSSNATRNAWNNDGSNAAAGTTCSACLLVLRILVLIVMLLVLGLLVLLGMSKCSSNGDARNDDRSNDDYAGSTDGRRESRVRMTISTDAGNDYNDVGNYADWNDLGNAVSSSNDADGRNPVPIMTKVTKLKRLYAFRTSSEMVTESIEVADMEKGKAGNAFDGLTESSRPLGMCRTITLPPTRTLEQAGDQLQLAINDLKSSPPDSESGILRLQVPLLQEIKALEWIQSQPQGSVLLPRCYFSSRCYRGSAGDSLSQDIFKKQFGEPEKNILKGVAGIGSAVLFKSLHPFSLKDWKTIRRFLSDDSPLVRAYGTIRFNSEMKPSTEWSEFGSFYFVIPQMELDEFDGNSVLAATIAWDNSLLWTFNKGLDTLELTLHQVSAEMRTSGNMLHLTMINKTNVPDEHSWDATVHKALELISLNSAEGWKNSPKLIRSMPFLDLSSLSKVVLARRSKLEIDGNIDPFELISSLQENDQNAYQFCFQLPKLSAFIGSTPEKLFYRNDSLVSSEAVAGTRARGHNSMEDLQIGLDLLYSSKDHREFEIVKENIKEKMETICKYVSVESEKSLIKQARVQHLYARLIGELKDEAGEFSLLSLLHPTPAVCGHPQEAARNFISQNEIFDRGMYAGPVGWFGGKEAEFAVGIRSALMQKNNLNSSQRNKFPQGTCLYLYAGAGIVKGSMPSSEWQELDLKASQFEELFQPNHALQKSPNISGVWASLSVKD